MTKLYKMVLPLTLKTSLNQEECLTILFIHMKFYFMHCFQKLSDCFKDVEICVFAAKVQES